MKSHKIAAILAATTIVCASAMTPASAKPGAAEYGALPLMSDVAISPDGKHVAMIANQGDRPMVTISKVGGTMCKLGSGGMEIADIYWANNNRLIVEAQKFADPAWEPGNKTSLFAQGYSVNTECGDAKKMNGQNVLALLPDGSLLMDVPSYNNTTRSEANTKRWRKYNGYKSDIFKIDPSTGKGEKYEQGSDTTIRWLVDKDGRVRMRFDIDVSYGRIVAFARLGSSDDWVQVYDQRNDKDIENSFVFIGIGARPDTAYVLTRNFGPRYGIYEFDFKSKSISRPLYTRTDSDVVGFSYGAYGRVPTGVIYAGEDTTVEYFDKDFAKYAADLRETFPGESRFINSVTKDKSIFIAYVEGKSNPGGVYYYVDSAKGELFELGKRYPLLTPQDIGPVKFYKYSARDGLQIPAYLTLPYGSPGKNLPLVVLPHGGPESRDNDNYDSWTQFLASRGYAVLQPQFRGSDGFGLEHRNAGRRQWGLAMQNDITDGVKNLISSGVADPNRVCIVGWSYGGYAALAGLAYSPELYKCGVAGAPVSDLPVMLEWASKNAGRWFRDDDEITKMIGNLKADYERLVATSPSRNAAKFRAPLLLVHPKFDQTVPIEQSEIMSKALKEASKPHEFVVIEGDDHHLIKSSSRVEFLKHLDRFLGQHLK